MANFKNIVGTGFPSYVTDQIEKRAEILNTTNRSNNILQYLTNRNVWFRLSSGANIDGNAEKAQLNTLQGGTILAGATQTRIRGGFNETYKKGTDDDLGLKPMPGITNVSIGTGGKWQTLMQADVEFVCYDLEQLDTMTKLYMSLGCNVFLEWGHSNYFKSKDNTFETNPSNINFFSTIDKDKILKDATEKRKNTEGNYECLLGRVYNFDWTANNDGSYNCKIQIMGAGAMAESLKINTSNKIDFTIFKTTKDDSSNYSSNLENILNSYKSFFTEVCPPLKTKLTGKKSSKNIETKFTQIPYDKVLNYFAVDNTNTIRASKLTYGEFLNKIFGSAAYKGPIIVDGKITSENLNVEFGNAHQIISNLQSPTATLNEFGNVTKVPLSLYNGYISSQTIDDEQSFCTYITLGHLFTLIQHIGIFTEKTNENIKPVIYLDYNPSNTIIKTSPFQASIDPSKCLIPYNANSEIQNNFFDGILFTNNDLQEYNLNSSDNPPPRLPGFNNELFSILINIDFVLNTLKSLSSNEDKTVTLMDFITRILDGINISLGKLNSFRPFFDKDSNCIRIIDENKIENLIKENKVIEIPNFGTRSLVYDYSFNSKISPKLASQIVIAAQANNNGLEEFSEEVLTYQYLNRGVQDRLSKEKLPAIRKSLLSSSTTKTDEINSDKALKKLFKYFFQVYNNFDTLKSDTINEMTNLYIDLQNKYDKSLIIESKTKPTFAIPIEYSIKIDGISGILPYNAFRIPENRLPKQYRTSTGVSGIDFAIFSINHEIENNKWYTILRGQIITRN